MKKINHRHEFANKIIFEFTTVIFLAYSKFLSIVSNEYFKINFHSLKNSLRNTNVDNIRRLIEDGARNLKLIKKLYILLWIYFLLPNQVHGHINRKRLICSNKNVHFCETNFKYFLD